MIPTWRDIRFVMTIVRFSEKGTVIDMSIQKGRVSLVTGAGDGLGKAIAVELAARGSYVLVQDLNMESAAKTVSIIEDKGGIAAYVEGDVSRMEDCGRFVQNALDKWGTLDILVNNAGIIRDALIHKMTPEQWKDVIDVNLSGVFYCTQAAVKVMKEKRFGRIINISSIGYIGYRGQANYAAAKAGVVALTRVTASEYAWCGVTANCVCPGTIATSMALGCMGGGDNWLNYVKENHPMGRPGKPEDVAFMVSALAAEEAGFINAQTIAVDGGFGRVRL